MLEFTNQLPVNKPNSNHSFLQSHGELAAALASGIIILFTWLMNDFLPAPLITVLYLSAFIIGGYAKAKEGILDTWNDKQLNVEMLMIFAAVGSAVIGYWLEGALLIFIFAISGALETYTENKNRKEISALMSLQPESATLLTSDGEKIVPVSALTTGAQIVIKSGDRIPADGMIRKGRTTIDESVITGESVPQQKEIGQEIFAGTVNGGSPIIAEITKPADQTLFQRIINLVQDAQKEKSPSQQFIDRFEAPYVKIILAAVLLMMILPPLTLSWTFTESFYRAMILLVVASPCALVASVTPASLSAISKGARSGILVKGGVHLENLAGIKAVSFDKTGSLTIGKPEVTDFYVRSEADKLYFLTAAAAIEKHSTHPLAEAIVHFSNTESAASAESITDEAGIGIAASWNNTSWRIGKASFMRSSEAMMFLEGVPEALAAEGKSLVFLEDEKGIAAVFALKDTLRPEAMNAVSALNQLGVATVMLTGDNEHTAEAIAKEAGITGYRANCLPEEKVTEIKALQHTYRSVAMVGDGINDAPALATAEVGIAMGNGTDAALETADIVLMNSDLSKLAEAIKLSKRMNRIIKQNVIFSIAVIALLIASNFAQALALPFGVIGHEGSTILVILNGLRLLK